VQLAVLFVGFSYMHTFITRMIVEHKALTLKRLWSLWQTDSTYGSRRHLKRSKVWTALMVSSLVSERPRSTVPVRLLCPGRRCWHSATAAFQQPSTSCSTTLPAQYLWMPGLAVTGPTVWNSLPDFIRDPTISADCFRRLLKTYCLLDTSALSALEVLWRLLCYINVL